MVDFDKYIGLAVEFCKDRFSNYKYLAEDIQQQAYLGLWKACQTFDATKGFEFSTYAYRCMSTEVFSYLKIEKRFYSVATNYKLDNQEGAIDLIDLQVAEPDKERFDLLVIQSELADKVKPKVFEAVNLCAKGYIKSDIAQIQGVSTTTVTNRIRKCAEILKNKN